MNGGDRAEVGDRDRDRIRIECEHLRVSDGLADWGMGLNRVAPPSAVEETSRYGWQLFALGKSKFVFRSLGTHTRR